MGRLPRTLGWVALLLIAGLSALSWLALERAPRVTASQVPAAESLRHLRLLFRAHDPRRQRPGTLNVISATPADLQLLASHGARLLDGAAEVELGEGWLTVRASLPARRNLLTSLFGGWLNTELQLGDGDTLPTVQRLRIGSLSLPTWLAGPLLHRLLSQWSGPDDGLPPLTDMLKGVRLHPERAQMVYEWRVDTQQRILGALLPPAQQARLRAYHERLAALTREQRGPLTVPALLAPIFTLAKQRSANGEDPAAENRAALVTLALYAIGQPLSSVLPSARQWPRAHWRPVLMRGRIDFPQHLLISAALAAQASGPLADALGLAKEVSDARYGSGFSFNDMAVNRAGARLGTLAVEEPLRLQSVLAGPVDEAALLPDVSDLPEFLSEAEFSRRYGGVDEPAYRQLVAEIERRVLALPLLR